MSEKEEPKKEEPEAEPKDTDEGGKSETVKDTERINAETERLNKAIAENENAKAKAKIGGVTLGPEQPAQVSEEDKKKAGAKEFFKGTQLEKDIDKL